MNEKLKEELVYLEVLATINYKEIISNSYLSDIKRVMMGIAPFFGDEAYLRVGKEFHRRLLEPEKPPEAEFSQKEDEQMFFMEVAYRTHYSEWLKDSEKELRVEGNLYGAECKGFIDIKKVFRPKRVGVDIKTTSCRNYAQFMKAAKDYGYFRQGHVYTVLDDLDDFVFHAVTKHPPYQVFELKCSNFKNLMKEAEEETKFLVNMYLRFIKK